MTSPLMKLLVTQFLWALCFLPALLASVCNATPIKKRSSKCTDVIIPVTISTKNERLPPDLSIDNVGGLLGGGFTAVFDLPTAGTFQISACFCEPEVNIPARKKTLQLLVHGATYTRDYWSGGVAPGQSYDGGRYSWLESASKQGYPTLAIDRLGNGKSDHPNGVLVTQYPAQVEVLHQIVSAIRFGTAAGTLHRTFNKIIYIGHSYGSIIGNGLSAKYPDDVDALILTGYSSNYTTAMPALMGAIVMLPAAIVDAQKYGHLDTSYLEATSKTGTANTYYWNTGYDSNVFELDWSLRGTFSLGEALSILSGPNTTAFKGQVFTMTGEHDIIFCNPLGLAVNSLLGQPSCGSRGSGYLAQTKTLYPAAKTFDWYAVPNSGHCWQRHYSAFEAFRVAHNWMAKQGY